MTGKFMTIDNIPIELTGEEKNLLEVIRRTGIELPTFCYYSELSVYGACRMCMVEDDRGNIHAACSTPPKAGMTIYTNTSRLRKYRRNILELLLANHCRDCTTCEKSSDCKLSHNRGALPKRTDKARPGLFLPLYLHRSQQMHTLRRLRKNVQ